MSNILVTYFSASGVTKKVAEKLASIINGDLFEIEPKEKYTEEDLNWRNKESRSSIEMKNKFSRPEIVNKNINLSNYDIILIGFPVWWYTAPTIINTFIESMDFTRKKLIPFCTSGGSGISQCEKDLRQVYSKYIWQEGRRLTGSEDERFIKDWLKF